MYNKVWVVRVGRLLILPKLTITLRS